LHRFHFLTILYFLKKVRPGENREIFAFYPWNSRNWLSAKHLRPQTIGDPDFS